MRWAQERGVMPARARPGGMAPLREVFFPEPRQVRPP